ncbi:hypothetical protein LTR85_011931 [Meristemomyces frigidus]|nr:hypothetical protein LTR85_011931 [Meristemomyces frigidus]
MREKLDRLEHFVNGLRGSGVEVPATHAEVRIASISEPQAGPQDRLANLAGKLRLSETGSTQFIGPSHWEAIIEDLADVKGYFDLEDDPATADDDEALLQSESNVPTMDINFGLMQTYSKQQLLDMLPTKPIMNRLLAAWFNAMDPLRLIVHAPTFQAEYQRFWQQPDLVSTSWLALLYSIGSLGAEVSGESCNDPVTLALAEDMRRLTVHALVACDYAALPPYAVEALLLHIKSSLLKHIDVTRELYLRLGLLTRLCTLAGYHRDPSNNPEISPFKAEMRRRIWWFASKYDILMCYQLGQLSVINQVIVDTAPPSNLSESDLTLAVIPPAKPLTEQTSITTALVFGDLTAIFGEVVYSSYSTLGTAGRDVARLHARLEQARNDRPPQLRMVTLEHSLLEPPELIIGRYILEALHLKSVCILYRRYLGLEGHLKERRHCLNAAEQLVLHQNTLLEAGQPGGLLPQADLWLRRFIHDFIFAAMLLCLQFKTFHATESGTTEHFDSGVRLLLQYACRLWSRIMVTSPKARHALRAIERFVGQEMPCIDAADTTLLRDRSALGFDSSNDHRHHAGSFVSASLVDRVESNAQLVPNAAVPGSLPTMTNDSMSTPLDDPPGLDDIALDGTMHDWDPLFQDLFGAPYHTADDSGDCLGLNG